MGVNPENKSRVEPLTLICSLFDILLAAPGSHLQGQEEGPDIWATINLPRHLYPGEARVDTKWQEEGTIYKPRPACVVMCFLLDG